MAFQQRKNLFSAIFIFSLLSAEKKPIFSNIFFTEVIPAFSLIRGKCHANLAGVLDAGSRTPGAGNGGGEHWHRQPHSQ